MQTNPELRSKRCPKGAEEGWSPKGLCSPKGAKEWRKLKHWGPRTRRLHLSPKCSMRSRCWWYLVAQVFMSKSISLDVCIVNDFVVSEQPAQVSTLKTTVSVESHWKAMCIEIRCCSAVSVVSPVPIWHRYAGCGTGVPKNPALCKRYDGNLGIVKPLRGSFTNSYA